MALLTGESTRVGPFAPPPTLRMALTDVVRSMHDHAEMGLQVSVLLRVEFGPLCGLWSSGVSGAKAVGRGGKRSPHFRANPRSDVHEIRARIEAKPEEACIAPAGRLVPARGDHGSSDLNE